MLKYIFFDLDDTILNFTAGEANALSQALSEAGIIPTQAVLDRYHVIKPAGSYWRRAASPVMRFWCSALSSCSGK